jgi:hypothetical protein
LNTVRSFNDNETGFIEMSAEISNMLFGLMTKHVDIPPADILIAASDIDGRPYLSILKLKLP